MGSRQPRSFRRRGGGAGPASGTDLLAADPSGPVDVPSSVYEGVKPSGLGLPFKSTVSGSLVLRLAVAKGKPPSLRFSPGPSPHPLGSAAHLDGPWPCSSTCWPVRAFSAAAVGTGNSFQMHIREQQALVRGVGTVGEREEGRSHRRGGAGGRFWNRAGVSDAGLVPVCVSL